MATPALSSNNPERLPLLSHPTDATPSSSLTLTNQQYSSQTQQHAPLEPTGRGKLRFGMRQQLQMTQSSRSRSSKRYMDKGGGSIYKSIFTSQHHHEHTGKGDTAQRESTNSYETRQFDKPNKNQPTLPKVKDTTIIATSCSSPNDTEKQKHSRLYNILNPKSHSSSALNFQEFISITILLDSMIYIVSTEPKFAGVSFFYIAEGVTSTIFLIEYIGRVVVCTEQKKYSKYGPLKGRWKYMCSSQALIDGFATLPFFIELLTGVNLPTLTYLRIFRLLRITRTHSYSKAMDAVGRVFYFNREILHVAALLGVYLVLFTSILMYYLRPRGKDIDMVDDASDFESISATMVLSMLMLTGQGGPSGNLPWYTQCVVLLTGVFSIGMFNLIDSTAYVMSRLKSLPAILFSSVCHSCVNVDLGIRGRSSEIGNEGQTTSNSKKKRRSIR